MPLEFGDTVISAQRVHVWEVSNSLRTLLSNLKTANILVPSAVATKFMRGLMKGRETPDLS
jgi:hypothetical protein